MACNKEVGHPIESTMAEQGLNYKALAQRLCRDESSVRQFVRDVGTKKHRLAVTTGISLTLGKPSSWLLEVLQERGLR